MRRILRLTYRVCGIAAALCLVLILILIIAQIGARQLNTHIPSSGDVIGFAIVWAAFLGMPYTMHHQAHIRVELITSRFTDKQRQFVNIFIGFFATALLAVLSFHIIMLIHESWHYKDVTDGEIPFPLWVMQLPMGIGIVLFCLSMLDYTLMQFKPEIKKEVLF